MTNQEALRDLRAAMDEVTRLNAEAVVIRQKAAALWSEAMERYHDWERTEAQLREVVAGEFVEPPDA